MLSMNSRNKDRKIGVKIKCLSINQFSVTKYPAFNWL